MTVDDRVIRVTDHLVNDWGRRFAAPEVRSHRRHRHIGQHELSAPHFVGSGASECVARELFHGCFCTPRVDGNLVLQCLGPIALNEIIAVVEQKQATLIEMLAHPGRGVQRGP